MKLEYYISTYHLSSEESTSFQDLAKKIEQLHEEGTIKTYAHRWILEIRPKCQTEVSCRAILFRNVMESIWKANVPENEIKVALAWGQMITDHIQHMVEDMDAHSSLN